MLSNVLKKAGFYSLRDGWIAVHSQNQAGNQKVCQVISLNRVNEPSSRSRMQTAVEAGGAKANCKFTCFNDFLNEAALRQER